MHTGERCTALKPYPAASLPVSAAWNKEVIISNKFFISEEHSTPLECIIFVFYVSVKVDLI